jgi:outer membrane protein OmpA-like peptidoglycan-associated protein
MLYKVIFLIVLYFLPAAAMAGRFSDICEWLNINPSPRASGMGTSFYGISRGAYSALFNPAAPAFIDDREIRASHNILLSGTMLDSISYLEPESGAGSASFSVHYFGTGSMQKIRSGGPEDKFTNYDISINLGYSHPVTKKLAVGVNIKGIQSKLDDFTSQGVGADLGLFGKFLKNSSCGISVNNFSAPMTYRSTGEYLPFNISLGLSRAVFLQSEQVELTFALGAKYLDYEDWDIGFGMEHTAFGQFSIRAGYRYNTLDRNLSFPANFTAGAGINAKGILIDYAWVPYGEMGSTHRFGMGYRFKAKPKIIRKVNIKVAPTMYSPKKRELTINAKWINVIEIDKYMIEITDSFGNKIKTIEGPVKLDEYSWDGKDDAGNTAADGNYTVQLAVVTPSEEKLYSNKEEVIVDGTPPEFAVRYSTNRFSPDGDGENDTLTFYLSGSDNNMFDSYKVKIFNESGKTVKEFSGEKLPDNILWDGKDDYYSQPVANGQYTVVAQAGDIVGNKNILPKETISVYIPPKVVTKKIKIVEADQGLKINLTSKVLFDSGRNVLKAAGFDSLDEVVKVIKAYPENKVSIEGHSDSVGSAQYNKKLSLNRAQAIKDYLVGKGVEAERLDVKGWGEERPVASNRTRAGRMANRRVEIIILKEKISE